MAAVHLHNSLRACAPLKAERGLIPQRRIGLRPSCQRLSLRVGTETRIISPNFQIVSFVCDQQASACHVQQSRSSIITHAAADPAHESAAPPPRGILQTIKGWLKWFALLLACVPIWIGMALGLVMGLTIGRKKFLRHKDRSGQAFKDPPGLKHTHLEVNGIKLHCVTNGSSRKRKPLMLFLHGFPELWYSWRHQLTAFADDYEVAAIDLRGYGDSDKPRGQGEYIIDKLVSDTVAVVEALGHRQATLVAHDWGGMVAWFTAALHPDIIKRLVMVGLPHPSSWLDNINLNQLQRSNYMASFYAPWLPEQLLSANDFEIYDQVFSTKVKSGVGMRHVVLSSNEIDRYKQAFAQKDAWTGPLHYYRNMLDCLTRSPTPAWHRGSAALRAGIDTPTLMLYASDDQYLGPQLLKGTEKYVQNLDLQVVPDCSHFAQQDRPEEVNDRMRRWLNAHPVTSATATARAAAL